MRARAVSTVLDAALFVLLVGAAVGVLAAAPAEPDGGGDVAPATATTLATTTATVEYAPAESDGARTDRGTLAGLLASAAVANATLEGGSLTPDGAYVRAVREETAAGLGESAGDARLQVHARWRPLPGSGLVGEVSVGPEPPASADVHAATLAVPLSDAGHASRAHGRRTNASDRASNESDRAAAATSSARGGDLEAAADRAGCRGVGAAVARDVVDALFPPWRTAAALRDEDAAAWTWERYGRAASVSGAYLEDAPGGVDGVRARNRELADELAPSVEHACEAYDEPGEAARRAAPRTVRIVVRTWSP